MLGRILGIAGKTLVVAGMLILGFVAFQLWGTGVEEARGQDELGEEFAQTLAEDPEATANTAVDTTDPSTMSAELASVDPATAPAIAAPPAGEPVGIIEIPKIEVSRLMVQGTSRSDLKKGPGRYAGTPLPGQSGNAGVAGHRTTYGAPFNRIDELVPGDTITFSSQQGQFNYKVIPAPDNASQAWYTVHPSQTEVLQDKGDNRITLTACHPKYSAQERIIVHAVLETPPAPSSPPPPADAPTVAEEFDEGLGSSPEQLPKAIGWGLAAAAVAALAFLIGRGRIRRWIVYGLATPVVLFLIWNSYVHLDRYLPAI